MTITCGLPQYSVDVVAVGTINVTTNGAGATFTVTGPSVYSGSGTSWSQANAPVGIYSIVFAAIGGQVTPTDTNKTLTSGGSITFTGTYVPSTGSVSFTSAPSVADQVYIDNTLQPFITTPSSPITGLSPGVNNHTYKLTKAGYADATGTFSIVSGENTAIPVTFSGSVHVTSTPTGAEIFLAVSPGTPIDQSFATPKTFGSMTAESSGATATWNYKLTKAGYTDNTGNFLATAGQTIEVPITMLIVANIAAQSITVTPSSPCIEGTCSVFVSVTWINSGETAGSSNLTITASGGTSAITPPSYPSVAFAAGQTITRTFTVTGLDAVHSPHSICPSPNT